MNFFLSEEQRVKRTTAEERDLSRRLSRKILKLRLMGLAAGVSFISAVVVGLIALLLGKDSGAWAFPLMVTFAIFGACFYWLSRKDAGELEFMKVTLKEYRDFLEKVKGKA